MKLKIKTGLKGLFISFVIFVALILIINSSLFDEELKPEVVKIIQDVQMPIIEGNAYYAMMGITAVKDKNIVDAGHQLILRYLENRNNSKDELTQNDDAEILGQLSSSSTSWTKEFMRCDFKTELNCLSLLSSNLTQDYLNDPRLKTMLKRYHEIRKMKVYSPFLEITPRTPLVSYSSMITLSQIHLASTNLHHNRSKFLFNLNQDMKFWKMVLNQGQLLLDKMVAVSAIRNNVKFLSEYLRNNPTNSTNHNLIQEILMPLTQAELDLSESFISESRTFLNLKNSFDKELKWYENLLFQPNATANLYYDNHLVKMLELAKLPINELIKIRKSGFIEVDSGIQLDYIYNYFGKVLIKFGMIAYSDYVVRGHDLNNIIKMVGIQYQAKISDHFSVQQLLSQEKNVNSHNNQPFEYDKTSQQLQFECLDKYIECKIQL